MGLQEKLDAMKAQSRAKMPAEFQTILGRFLQDLRDSRLVDRVPKVGDKAPDFTLPNAAGQPVSLAGLLAKGSVVLSFYRGRW